MTELLIIGGVLIYVFFTKLSLNLYNDFSEKLKEHPSYNISINLLVFLLVFCLLPVLNIVAFILIVVHEIKLKKHLTDEVTRERNNGENFWRPNRPEVEEEKEKDNIHNGSGLRLNL